VTHRGRVGLLQVTELSFGEMLLLRQAERQLHGVIAVAIGRADRRHGTRPGLQHGHTRDTPIVLEDLGHAELLGEDGGHGQRS
jgi:hypothetical protein